MPGIFILFFAIAVGLVLAGILNEKKRRERFQAYARTHSYRYSPDKDRSFDEQFAHFPGMRSGSNRYFRHRFQAQSGDKTFVGGEYHYQITTSNGKSSSTSHYFFTVVLFQLPKFLGEVSIREEGIFDRMKAAFGWDDIDFASSAFSERFHVCAPNRNVAFELIQPSTMEFLMSHQTFELYLKGTWLMVRRKGKFRISDLIELKALGEGFLADIPGFVQEGARL